ncbi:MAG: glycosyltransferase family 9 protein [Bacteroidia bacterium]
MKILLIRFSSIGDIVLTSPVIRCIKEQIADAEVHVLVKPGFAAVLKSNPHISKIWNWEKGIIPQLKQQQFDRIIDLHHNLRSLRVKTALGKPSSSFPKLNIEKLMLVRLGINRLPNKHVVDRYFEAAQSLGVNNDGKGLSFFTTPDEERILEQLPPDFKSGYTAIVCGALQVTKRIPHDKLLEFSKAINGRIVLLGGASETDIGAKIEAEIGTRAMSFCGKTSLGESAVLLKHAIAVLTPDTGMMHIAAAFKKPIAVVWGNTVPAFGMGPYMPGNDDLIYHAEAPNLSCRPCSKIGFPQCPKGHFSCMNQQDGASLAAWLNRFSASL